MSDDKLDTITVMERELEWNKESIQVCLQIDGENRDYGGLDAFIENSFEHFFCCSLMRIILFHYSYDRMNNYYYDIVNRINIHSLKSIIH